MDLEYQLTVDSVERREKAAKVMELLRYIPKSESALFERHDSDNCSELDDPFSDDEDQLTVAIKKKVKIFTFLQDKIRKYMEKYTQRLSKIETDIYLMSSLSESHKRAAEAARRIKETSNTGICSEDLKNMTLEPAAIPEDKEFREEVKSILAQEGLDVYLQKKEQEQMERDAKNKSKVDPRQQLRRPVAAVKCGEANETNSMSGIWRMLDGQSVENGFPITEIGYNVYDDKRLNWLTREDLSYGDREAVKLKCEKWMKKCNL